jgi:holo-[acyl-carrier protein] synthase
MIRGTGIDVIDIDRVARSIERYGDRFLNRIYTAAEIAYCQRKRRNAAESFAARFAAKEAAAKALGTGMGFGVTWRQIEVGREPAGRPLLLLHGRAAEIAAGIGVRSASLSITHTAMQSFALVILED